MSSPNTLQSVFCEASVDQHIHFFWVFSPHLQCHLIPLVILYSHVIKFKRNIPLIGICISLWSKFTRQRNAVYLYSWAPFKSLESRLQSKSHFQAFISYYNDQRQESSKCLCQSQSHTTSKSHHEIKGVNEKRERGERRRGLTLLCCEATEDKNDDTGMWHGKEQLLMSVLSTSPLLQ